MSVNSVMAFGTKSWDTWFPTRWDENLNDFRFAFCKALDENEKQRLGWPPVNNNTHAGGILIHPKTSTGQYVGGISFNNGTPVYTGMCGTATSTNGYMYAVNDSSWLNCPTLAITNAVTAYHTMKTPKLDDNLMSTYDNLILQVDELTEDTSGQTCPNLWDRDNTLTANNSIDTIGGAYDRGPQNITKHLDYGTDWDKKAVEATFGIFLRSNIDIFSNDARMVIVTLGYRNDVVSQNWHYDSGCKHKFSAVHPVTGETYYYGYYLNSIRSLYEPSFQPFQLCRYAFPYIMLPYLTDQQKSTLQLKVLDFFLRIF